MVDLILLRSFVWLAKRRRNEGQGADRRSKVQESGPLDLWRRLDERRRPRWCRTRRKRKPLARGKWCQWQLCASPLSPPPSRPCPPSPPFSSISPSPPWISWRIERLWPRTQREDVQTHAQEISLLPTRSTSRALSLLLVVVSFFIAFVVLLASNLPVLPSSSRSLWPHGPRRTPSPSLRPPLLPTRAEPVSVSAPPRRTS